MHRVLRRAVVPAVALVGAFALPASASTNAAAWYMEEPAGATTMVDSSGGGHNGTIFHVTTGVPGPTGRGLSYRFNGSDSLVTVPDAPGLDPGTANIDLRGFLNVPSSLTFGAYNVLQKGVPTSPGGQYKIEIGGTKGRLGRVICTFTDSTGAAASVPSAVRINDGLWHQVDCLKSSTAVTVRIDNVTQGSVPASLGSISNAAKLALGGKPLKGASTQNYLGGMDDVGMIFG